MTNEKGRRGDGGHSIQAAAAYSEPPTTARPFNKIAYFECLRGVDFGRNVGALHVLAVLYSYSDAYGGSIRPGVNRLAADCCMAESTVRAHLKLLTERGFIRREYRGGRSGGGRTRASGYRLAIPSTAEPPAPVERFSTAGGTISTAGGTPSQPPVDRPPSSHRSNQVPTSQRDQVRARARSDRPNELTTRNGDSPHLRSTAASMLDIGCSEPLTPSERANVINVIVADGLRWGSDYDHTELVKDIVWSWRESRQTVDVLRLQLKRCRGGDQ